MFLMIIVNQGNSWTQTKSMKIERDIINYIKENKELIQNSKNIIFDASSFKENIDHTLVNNENNVLNTYYGFQLLEEWGIKSAISIFSEKKDLNIYYSVDEIKLTNNKHYSIKLRDIDSYRKYKYRDIRINYDETFLINYKDLYNKSSKRYFKN